MSKRYYIVPIFVPHLGCPHDCVFCNQKRISGVGAPPKKEALYNEINQSLATINYEQNPSVEIAFFGGSFTGIEASLQEEYLKVGYDYIQQGKVNALRISTRPDYIDASILERLKKYGVKIIELGVQSLHEDILMASNRGHCCIDVEKAAKLIKEKGFTLGIQLMPGLPKDSVERFKETVDRAVALKPALIRLYPTLVIKETALETAFFQNEYAPMTMEEAVEACAYGLEKCLANDIDVIRIGLQPSEGIRENGDVVAGPFHPTFRQLVEGMFFLKKLELALKACSNSIQKNELVIYCSPKQISSVSGLNKRNKNTLKEKYNFKKIKIIGQREQLPYTVSIEVF